MLNKDTYRGFILYNFLNSLDVYTTLLGLHLGLGELNPFGIWLISYSITSFVVLKLFTGFISSLALWNKFKPFKRLGWVVNFLYLLVILNNIYLIWMI